jgi:phosphoribosylformimino-5-aminoimidazole carboxamide ribotide isomerase
LLLIPSIDLRGGHCVRLLKGEFHAETVYEVDPRALLERYADAGVRWLHLVDLDGARDGTPGTTTYSHPAWWRPAHARVNR